MYVHRYMYLYIYIYIYIYTYIYIRMCVCVCVYTVCTGNGTYTKSYRPCKPLPPSHANEGLTASKKYLLAAALRSLISSPL